MSQSLLSVNGLMMRFGGLLAVNNVNLELYPQEIVSLIGPNGAGKTTVFNCLTGFYKPTGGTILLRDQHLEGLLVSKLPVWAWCVPSSMCACSVK